MGGRSKGRFVGTTGAITRKALLRVAKTLVAGMEHSLTDPAACMDQHMIEELAALLGIERCVIFKIDGAPEEFCEIAAGIPREEHEADVRQRSPLDTHPDIKAAMENGRVLVITHPLSDERTAYFRGLIETKDISEIAYVPLSLGEDRPTGVIVLDALHGRSFSDDEIEFCAEVAELLELLLGQESIMLQQFRDAIINRVVPLSGLAKRLQENVRTTLDYIEIIRKETTEIDGILPKKVNGGS